MTRETQWDESRGCVSSPQVVAQEDVVCVSKEAVQDKNAVNLKLKASSSCVSERCFIWITKGLRSRRKTKRLFGWRSTKWQWCSKARRKEENSRTQNHQTAIVLHELPIPLRASRNLVEDLQEILCSLGGYDSLWARESVYSSHFLRRLYKVQETAGGLRLLMEPWGWRTSVMGGPTVAAAVQPIMYGGPRQQCAWVCVCFWKQVWQSNPYRESLCFVKQPMHNSSFK